MNTVRKKKLVVLVILLAMLSNIFWDSQVPVHAFELREGDIIEDDELYADIEFDEPEPDDDDDDNEADNDDIDDDAPDMLEGNNINAKFKIVNSWQDHCNVEVTIENSLDEKIKDWKVRFDMEAEVENIWNAKVAEKDNSTYIIQNVNWNQDIEAGQSVTFGMILKCASDIEFPDKVFLIQKSAEVLDEYEVACKEQNRQNGNKVKGEITVKNSDKTYFVACINYYILSSKSQQTLEDAKFVASEFALMLSLVLYPIPSYCELIF